MLTQVALKYEPDLVLVCGFQGDDQLPSLDAITPANALVARSRASILYCALRQLVSSLRGSTSAHLLTRRDYALKMAHVLREHGVRGVFFDQADSRHGTGGGEGEILPPLPYLHELSRLPGMQAISVAPLSYQGDFPPFMLEGDHHHPSPLGHREIARVLATWLRDQLPTR